MLAETGLCLTIKFPKENKMFSVIVDDSPVIKVSTAKHEVSFGMDGSFMNPLEGFYATLAACAAVYAKKACMELGISAEGMEIACKPFVGAGGALSLSRFRTEVRFPAHVTAEQKPVIITSIQQCAVKKIVQGGSEIEFLVAEV